MSPVCKTADNGRLTVDQKVKAVLFYAETKGVVATQRRLARGCEAKRWSYWTCSSLGTIFQSMRINSVPDIKFFCNNKNALCVQSMVWHFVRHPVCSAKPWLGIVALDKKDLGYQNTMKHNITSCMTHDIFIVKKQFHYLCTVYLKNIRVKNGRLACVRVWVWGGVLNDVIRMTKESCLNLHIIWKAN